MNRLNVLSGQDILSSLDEESMQTCLAGRQGNQEKTTFPPTVLRAPHRFFSPTRMVSTKCIYVINTLKNSFG
ncbi:MAG: hypothetical protein ACFCUU_07875 [Cyclobacteriaceae bacterium]